MMLNHNTDEIQGAKWNIWVRSTVYSTEEEESVCKTVTQILKSTCRTTSLYRHLRPCVMRTNLPMVSKIYRREVQNTTTESWTHPLNVLAFTEPSGASTDTAQALTLVESTGRARICPLPPSCAAEHHYTSRKAQALWAPGSPRLSRARTCR